MKFQFFFTKIPSKMKCLSICKEILLLLLLLLLICHYNSDRSIEATILSENRLATPNCLKFRFPVNTESLESCSVCSETGFLSKQLFMKNVCHGCGC